MAEPGRDPRLSDADRAIVDRIVAAVGAEPLAAERIVADALDGHPMLAHRIVVDCVKRHPALAGHILRAASRSQAIKARIGL